MIACNSDNSTNPENNTNNNSGWTQTSFPSGLYGDWYNSSGAWIFGITDSTTIRTGNQFYELVVTYTKDNVYKAITTLSGEYYTFFFKDITSTSMSATGRSGPYSTQSEAENASPGTYYSYTKG